MNTEELRRLATRAEGIEGRQVGRLDELHGRIRTARRRRATAGVLATAGAVVAIVVTSAALDDPSRTQAPIDHTPDPNPTETDQAVPAGQATILPEIGPGDIRGWDLRGSRTNTDQDATGATDLSLTVETGGLDGGQSYADQFCHGTPDTWWVLTYDLDGVDGVRLEGGPENGTRARFGQCSPDAPTTMPAPSQSFDPGPAYYRQPSDTYPFRMFVTEAIPRAAQQCLQGTFDSDACVAEHGLVPLAESDATFGFGIYEHLSGPVVLEGLGGAMAFEALQIADGVEYLVERAVVAAPGARRLVAQVPASDRTRIVGLVDVETKAAGECGDQLGIDDTTFEGSQEFVKVFPRRCLATVELQVGGQPAKRGENSPPFGSVVLPPGEAHELTVEVVRNDPRHIRFALVIWKERS